MVWIVVAGIAGTLVGYLTARVLQGRHRVGTLRVDRSDSAESPYLFLELDADGMRRIQAHRTVTLDVRTENYLPRN